MKCSECDQIQNHLTALKRHFVFNLPPNQKQFICQSCSAVYFSLCSFSAHKRSHQKEQERQSPYTCPECGILQPSSKALCTHLLNHKSAPTIINAWRCHKCFTFYSNWHTLVVHIATNHSEYYFKCPRCPTAYQGFTNYDEHRRVHTVPGQEPLQAEMVPKCPNCESILKNREQMIEHLKGHLQNMDPLKVYRCPICGRLMENKNGLIAHYSRTHYIMMRPQDVVDKAFEIDDTPHNAPSPSYVRIAPKLQAHAIMGQKPMEKAGYSSHSPASSISDRSSNPSAGLEPAPGMALRCPKCPPHAQTVLLSQFMLQLHMKVKHGEEYQGGPSPSGSASGMGGQQGGVSAAYSHGHGHHPAYAQQRVSARSSGGSHSAMKGGYACKKFGCFFVAGTREEMRSHAASTHRDSTHFLCLECGLSFVAEEALRRHLLAHHQITDPCGYVRQYRDCLPLLGTQVGHKCSVCGSLFASEMELHVHSRKHGMLFLQQRSGTGSKQF